MIPPSGRVFVSHVQPKIGSWSSTLYVTVTPPCRSQQCLVDWMWIADPGSKQIGNSLPCKNRTTLRVLCQCCARDSTTHLRVRQATVQSSDGFPYLPATSMIAWQTFLAVLVLPGRLAAAFHTSLSVSPVWSQSPSEARTIAQSSLLNRNLCISGSEVHPCWCMSRSPRVRETAIPCQEQHKKTTC